MSPHQRYTQSVLNGAEIIPLMIDAYFSVLRILIPFISNR